MKLYEFISILVANLVQITLGTIFGYEVIMTTLLTIILYGVWMKEK